MRRLRIVSMVLVGILAVGAVVGAVAASGRARHVQRAREHAAAVAHPRSAVGGQARAALASGAARGGRVIVLLRNTNSGVSLAHGLARRRAVDRSQRRRSVSKIKQSGRQQDQAADADQRRRRERVGERGTAAGGHGQRRAGHPRPAGHRVGAADADGEQRGAVASTCTRNPNKPMIEPEALADMHSEGPGADEADTIADGSGVVVAIDGMNGSRPAGLPARPTATRGRGRPRLRPGGHP